MHTRSGKVILDPCDFPSVAELTATAAAATEAEFTQRFHGAYLVTEAIHHDDGAWRSYTTSTVPAVKPGQQRAALAINSVEKREQTNPYRWMITLGRTLSNDIVLPDISISKLHAWIRRGTDEARFTVTDAGSRNGTFVDGVALRGESSPLSFGSRLRLGRVEMLFVDGCMLYRAIRRATAVAA
jgi:hypothetical protein